MAIKWQVGPVWRSDGHPLYIVAVLSDGHPVVGAYDGDRYCAIYNADGSHPDLLDRKFHLQPPVVVSDAALDAYARAYDEPNEDSRRAGLAAAFAVMDAERNR